MIIYVIGLTRFATMTATTTIATTRRDKARIKIPPKGCLCGSAQCSRNDSSAISQYTLPITKPINFHRKSIIHHRKPFGEVLTVKYYAFVAHGLILSYGARCFCFGRDVSLWPRDLFLWICLVWLAEEARFYRCIVEWKMRSRKPAWHGLETDSGKRL